MAFKSVTEYKQELYGGLFLLRDDGDHADVIFLFQSENDMLIADTHYIKSPEYSGYVHCCGKGCPACAKGIRVQTKLFIPIYNVDDDEIQFWDRGVRFQNIMYKDVLNNYPNPSEVVFRVTRHGASGDMNTKYSIAAVAKNTSKPYDKILADNNITFPDYYSNICREYTIPELGSMLDSKDDNAGLGDLPDYQVTPRGEAKKEQKIDLPDSVYEDDADGVEESTDSKDTDDKEPVVF